MPDKLTAESFQPHLDGTFVVRVDLIDPAYPVLNLTLTSVTLLGEAPPEGADRRHAFSLVFLGPQDPVLAQRTFRVDNDLMGSLDLFLVPVGPNRQGMQYEAVFT